jgi:DNA-binding MurR/RpiR family transcriptional regulator
LSSPSVAEAAKAAGLSEATLWRHLREENFVAHYRASRRELVQHMTVRLHSRAESAVQVLGDIAEDKAAPASARVTAARAIIEHTLKAAELEDLGERVAALEKLL